MGSCISEMDAPEAQAALAEAEAGNVRPKPDFEARWKDDIVAIWGRPLSKLPVHTDVPRLTKKMTVKSEAGDFIFDGSDAKYKATNMAVLTKTLLLSIAKALDDKELRSQLKKWDDYVPDSGDTAQHLIAFFDAVVTAGGETATLLVLKTIHQRVIFPAFYCLKDLLQNSVGRFKDRAGSWSVNIQISEGGKVTVTHRKEQQAVTTTPKGDPEFEFSWQLMITIDILNKSISRDVLVKLSDLEINDDTPADTRKLIESAFEKYKTVS